MCVLLHHACGVHCGGVLCCGGVGVVRTVLVVTARIVFADRKLVDTTLQGSVGSLSCPRLTCMEHLREDCLL